MSGAIPQLKLEQQEREIIEAFSANNPQLSPEDLKFL